MPEARLNMINMNLAHPTGKAAEREADSLGSDGHGLALHELQSERREAQEDQPTILPITFLRAQPGSPDSLFPEAIACRRHRKHQGQLRTLCVIPDRLMATGR